MEIKEEILEDVSFDSFSDIDISSTVKIEERDELVNGSQANGYICDNGAPLNIGSVVKRKRTGNFSTAEETLLMQLVKPVSEIIENKKGDCISVKSKQEAWQTVTDGFNVHGYDRSLEQLKNFYDNIKRRLRRKISEGKSPILLNNNEETLLELLRKKSTAERSFVINSAECSLISEQKFPRCLLNQSPRSDASRLGLSNGESENLVIDLNNDDGSSGHEDFQPSSSGENYHGKNIELLIHEQRLLNLKNENRRQEEIHRLRIKHMKLDQLRKDELHHIQIASLTKS